MPGQANQQSANRRASQIGFAVEFNSGKDRDRFVSASLKLKNHTTTTVFGDGGNSRVSIRQLWPKEVHALFSDALMACKRYHDPRPIVSNLVVGVRKSKNDRFTYLLSQEDLNAFLAVSSANPANQMEFSASQSEDLQPQLPQLPTATLTQSQTGFLFGGTR